jgi:PilZ domain
MPETVYAKKRRYARASLPHPIVVAWRSPTRNNIARISCLGLGGLFIHEAEPPPPGAVIQLLFETPNGQVRARATVRTAEPGRGMGVEFMQMKQEERARLAYMIRKLLG